MVKQWCQCTRAFQCHVFDVHYVRSRRCCPNSKDSQSWFIWSWFSESSEDL